MLTNPFAVVRTNTAAINSGIKSPFDANALNNNQGNAVNSSTQNIGNRLENLNLVRSFFNLIYLEYETYTSTHKKSIRIKEFRFTTNERSYFLF